MNSLLAVARLNSVITVKSKHRAEYSAPIWCDHNIAGTDFGMRAGLMKH